MRKEPTILDQGNATTQSEMEELSRRDPETSSSSASSPLPTHLWRTSLIVGALCLSVILIALDYTIMTTAIPRIT